MRSGISPHAHELGDHRTVGMTCGLVWMELACLNEFVDVGMVVRNLDKAVFTQPIQAQDSKEELRTESIVHIPCSDYDFDKKELKKAIKFFQSISNISILVLPVRSDSLLNSLTYFKPFPLKKKSFIIREFASGRSIRMHWYDFLFWTSITEYERVGLDCIFSLISSIVMESIIGRNRKISSSKNRYLVN